MFSGFLFNHQKKKKNTVICNKMDGVIQDVNGVIQADHYIK